MVRMPIISSASPWRRTRSRTATRSVDYSGVIAHAVEAAGLVCHSELRGSRFGMISRTSAASGCLASRPSMASKAPDCRRRPRASGTGPVECLRPSAPSRAPGYRRRRPLRQPGAAFVVAAGLRRVHAHHRVEHVSHDIRTRVCARPSPSIVRVTFSLPTISKSRSCVLSLTVIMSVARSCTVAKGRRPGPAIPPSPARAESGDFHPTRKVDPPLFCLRYSSYSTGP